MPGDKFLVIGEADDIAATYPERSPGELASELEQRLASYDRGEAIGRAVVAELRARERAGIRFWPLVDPASVPIEDLIDDEIPW